MFTTIHTQQIRNNNTQKHTEKLACKTLAADNGWRGCHGDDGYEVVDDDDDDDGGDGDGADGSGSMTNTGRRQSQHQQSLMTSTSGCRRSSTSRHQYTMKASLWPWRHSLSDMTSLNSVRSHCTHNHTQCTVSLTDRRMTLWCQQPISRSVPVLYTGSQVVTSGTPALASNKTTYW